MSGKARDTYKEENEKENKINQEKYTERKKKGYDIHEWCERASERASMCVYNYQQLAQQHNLVKINNFTIIKYEEILIYLKIETRWPSQLWKTRIVQCTLHSAVHKLVKLQRRISFAFYSRHSHCIRLHCISLRIVVRREAISLLKYHSFSYRFRRSYTNQYIDIFCTINLCTLGWFNIYAIARCDLSERSHREIKRGSL